MCKRANNLDELLRAFPSIEQVTFRSGQILVYAGHYPHGVVVVVKGCVVVEEPGDVDSVIECDADAGSFFFPNLHELDLKAARTVFAKSPVEMFIAPLSLIKTDEKVRQLLLNADLVPISLQHTERKRRTA